MKTVENFLNKNAHFLGENYVPSGRTHFVRSTVSKESLTHLDKNSIINAQYESICQAFEIKESISRRQAFNHAVNGSGNEWLEITQLNSSALLAFLCFSGVSESDSLKSKVSNHSHTHILRSNRP